MTALSIELLEDAIALAHPDRHPAERAARANRVTAQLLALRPHVQDSVDPGPAPGEQRIPLWVSFRTLSASGLVVSVPAYLLKIKINSVAEGSSLELFDAKTETNASTGVLKPHADTRYLAIHHRTAICARIRGAMDVTFFFIK
jgi:hypothetical protein